MADPHNATRGFFFAHMGWLLIKKHPAIVEAGKKLNYDDLANDSTVSFQKKLGVILLLSFALAVTRLCAIPSSSLEKITQNSSHVLLPTYSPPYPHHQKRHSQFTSKLILKIFKLLITPSLFPLRSLVCAVHVLRLPWPCVHPLGG